MGAVGNIDTMYFQVGAENFYAKYRDLLRALHQTLEHKFMTKDRKPAFFELGGINFGFTNGRYSWSYGLQCTDFHLFFIGINNPCDNVLPLYVEFSQQYLWLYGYQKAYARFMDWLKNDCGLEGLETKISRADICVHTDDAILQEEYLQYIYYDPRCEVGSISDVEFTIEDLDNINGGRFDIFQRAKEGYTGIRVGKGQPLMARIYNKTLEIKSSKKEWFNEIWREAGLDPGKVNNIEFEIKREWFNIRDINTVEDFLEKVGDVWQFLTKNYLSFRLHDNTRRSRRTICDWWQALRDETFFYNGSLIARRKMGEINLDKSVDGMLGYAVSYAAGTKRKNFDLKMFMEVYERSKIKDSYFISEDKPSFPERIKHKSNRGFVEIADQENIWLDEYKEVVLPDYERNYGSVKQKIGVKNW